MTQEPFNQAALPDTHFSARAVEELTDTWQKTPVSLAVKNMESLKGQKFVTRTSQGWEAEKTELGTVSAPIMRHSIVFDIITSSTSAVTDVIDVRFYKDNRGVFTYSLSRTKDTDKSVHTTTVAQDALNCLAMLRNKIANLHGLSDMNAVMLRQETKVAAPAPTAPAPKPSYEGR